MTCHDARTAGHLALDGRLDGAARAAWEAHLAGCAACRAAQAGLTRVPAAFAAAPLPGAPVDLLGRLGLAEADPVAVPLRRPARRWAPFAGGLVAAAMLVAVGLGVRPGAPPAVVALSPLPATLEEAAEPDAILVWFGPEADPVDPLE